MRVPPTIATETGHFRSILKATSLIGGSSFINILIAMVRTKFVAILIGPSGIGLIGIYGTITGMVSTFSGMGLSASGVRKIAESKGTGNEASIARTVITLRRTVWLSGCLGMLICAAGANWWSRLSFDSPDHTWAIAFLGITILLGTVSMGQSCILQGTRRIADIAKINILGALFSTLISIPCYYWWGLAGIVPSLLLCSLAGLLTSWWFARKVPIPSLSLSWHESREEASRLLSFGFPLMLTGLGGALTAYIIRMILIREVGMEGVGLYQAALALSCVLVDFILSAMGTDYYPRLTAVAFDNRKISREVNAQVEIALLLAVPGLAATLIFAPLAINLFYTDQFVEASDVLRWLVFGVFGRVILWPVGFVMLAKGKSRITLWAEALNDLVWVCLTWVCVKQWGVDGAGIAFAFLYLFTTALFLSISKAIADTTWTRSNVGLILAAASYLILLALNCYFSPVWVKWSLNIPMLVLVSMYCLHRLAKKTGITLKSILARVGRPAA